MSEENDQNNNDYSTEQNMPEEQRQPQRGGMPEPPLSWKPTENNSAHHQAPAEQKQGAAPSTYRIGAVGDKRVQLSGDEALAFESARKLVSIAQICAVISLFVGGVVLSTIALVLAIAGYRRLTQLARGRGDEPAMQAALSNPARIAIVLSTVALLFNVVTLVYVYPLVMQAMQSGDVTALLGGSQGTAPSAGGGSSTWG